MSFKSEKTHKEDNNIKCSWKEIGDYWVTDCGHQFIIESGTPGENYMTYCCYCGKEIAEVKWLKVIC